jgi:hypothetical protein
MKTRYAVLIQGIVFFSVLFFITEAYAQDDEGFIKRMFRRFKREEPAVSTEKKPVEPAERPAAEPAEPEQKQPPLVIDKPVAEEGKKFEDMTEQELVKNITEELDDNPDILDFIPQLEMKKDADGAIFYTYRSESGVAKRIKELKKDTLVKLAKRVGTESSRLNSERIMRELERADSFRTPRPPAVPAQPPRTIESPRIPSTPSTYTPPRIPSTPGRPEIPGKPAQPSSVPTAPVEVPRVPRR